MLTDQALAALFRDLARTLASAELQRDLDELGTSPKGRIERLHKYLTLTCLKHQVELVDYLDSRELTLLVSSTHPDAAQAQLSYQIALQVLLRMPYTTARRASAELADQLTASELALARLHLSGPSH
jgi:hypothetical protein